MNLLALTRLQNGSEEPSISVAVTMMALKNLIQDDPLSFFELVSKARDRGHEIPPHQTNVLVGLHLMEPEGTLHQTIRNVILSAVTGESLGMTLQDPRAR